MVATVAAGDVDAPRVLAALKHVPRHRFVPQGVRGKAYADTPLPIGHQQTISQPYIVGFMSQAADVQPGEKVLEIGTGSGYQAAVLAELGAKVFTVEIVEPLAQRAQATLQELGYKDVKVRHGDGYAGWPERAPFDAIVVTAAPPQLPEPLVTQLAEGGRLVVPVGPAREVQQLEVYAKRDGSLTLRSTTPVRFVPMTGRAQDDGAAGAK